jgi:hypothetical protein
VSDPSDQHEVLIVVDGVHDPVVADADSIVVASGEPCSSWRSGIIGQAVDRCGDTVAQGVVQTPVRTSCLGV